MDNKKFEIAGQGEQEKKSKADLPDALSGKDLSEGKDERRDEIETILGAEDPADHEGEEGLRRITPEELRQERIVKAIYAQILGESEGEEITDDEVKGINSRHLTRNFQIAGFRKFHGYSLLRSWGGSEFGFTYALKKIQVEVFKIAGAAEEAAQAKEKKGLKEITVEELRRDDVVKAIYAQILGKGEGITNDEVKGINSGCFGGNFVIEGYRKFHGHTFLKAWGSSEFGFPYALLRIQAEVFKIPGAAEEAVEAKEEKGLKKITAAELISDDAVKAIYAQILGKGEGEEIIDDEVKGINCNHFQRDFPIEGYRKFHGLMLLRAWGGNKFGYYYAVKRIQAQVFGITGASEEAAEAKMTYLEKKGKLKIDFKIILTLPEVATRVSELLEEDENLHVELAEKRAIEEYLAKNTESPKKPREKKKKR